MEPNYSLKARQKSLDIQYINAVRTSKPLWTTEQENYVKAILKENLPRLCGLTAIGEAVSNLGP